VITLQAIVDLAVDAKITEDFTPSRDMVVARYYGAHRDRTWFRVYVRDKSDDEQWHTVEKRDSVSPANAARSVAEFRVRYSANGSP